MRRVTRERAAYLFSDRLGPKDRETDGWFSRSLDPVPAKKTASLTLSLIPTLVLTLLTGLFNLRCGRPTHCKAAKILIISSNACSSELAIDKMELICIA